MTYNQGAWQETKQSIQILRPPGNPLTSQKPETDTRSFQSFAETGPYWHSGRTCLKLTGRAIVQNQNTEQTRQTNISRCNILTRLLDDVRKQMRFIHYNWYIVNYHLSRDSRIEAFSSIRERVQYHIESCFVFCTSQFLRQHMNNNNEAKKH